VVFLELFRVLQTVVNKDKLPALMGLVRTDQAENGKMIRDE
jgi:hypothetical protein